MEQSEIWTGLLRSFNSRMRFIAMAGLGLFIIVFSDWHFQIENLQSSSRRLADVLFDLSSVEKYQNEAKQQAQLNRKNPLGRAIKIEELPQLSRDVRMKLQDAVPKKQYKIGSYTLPAVPYRLTILFAPVVLLFIALITAVQLRRIHTTLGPFLRSNPEVQLLLNSPVFDRVTLQYGERRWLHFLAVAAAYVPIVLSAAMYIPAVLMTELEPVMLFVTKFGYLPPPPPAIGIVRADELATPWIAILGLTVVFWLVLSYMATRPWYSGGVIDEENKTTPPVPDPSDKTPDQDAP